MAATPSAIAGANVRAEMARRGISQTLVGDRLSLSQPAISARLRGQTPFDLNELVAIAEFLEVPVAALIGDKAAS
ncbi:helix-turn-helix domain-containing protein [Mycobacterium sp. NPDC004974]